MTYSIDDALVYISKVDWRFANAMPTIPHEYTLREWRPELEPEFLALAHLIRTEGTIEPWPVIRPKYHMHYLVVGDNKYWAMGPPLATQGRSQTCGLSIVSGILTLRSCSTSKGRRHQRRIRDQAQG